MIVRSANVGGISFSDPKTVSSTVKGPRYVMAADLDADGDLDLLVTNTGDDSIIWFENNGGGAFSSAVDIATLESADISSPGSAIAADLDGDNRLDILAANTDKNELVWFKGTDIEGSFSTESELVDDDLDGVGWALAVHIDDDDFLDIITTVAMDDSVLMYKNDGSGDFFLDETLSVDEEGATHAAVADLDGDGDMDVVSASHTKLAWFENEDGEDFFSGDALESSGSGWTYVDVADIDGDNDIDVISSSTSPDSFYLFLNDEGDFSTGISLGLIDGAEAVFAGDLDEDGDMDIVGCASGSGEILFYENTGEVDTLLANGTVINQFPGCFHVTAADLDGDGDLDLVVSSTLNNEIGWLENLLDSTFTGGEFPEKAIYRRS